MTDNAPPTLKVTGDGAHLIVINLEPVHHTRFFRTKSLDGPIIAAVLTGADFDGGIDEGLGRFEANSYAPEGMVDDDGARCLLASFEFHSVVLRSANNGIFRFTGRLAAAEAYPQDVHDRINDGTPVTDIAEMNGDQGFTYMPPAFSPLEPFHGWTASITLVPVDRATGAPQ